MPRLSSPLHMPTAAAVALAQAGLLLLGGAAAAGQATTPAAAARPAVTGPGVPVAARPAPSAAVVAGTAARPEPPPAARPALPAPVTRPPSGQTAAARARAVPVQVVRPSVPAAVPVARRRSSSSSEELRAAVHRVPDRRAREARWVVSRQYGSWGTADWYRNTVYVSPDVPRQRLDDVVLHEWSHLASVLPYGGDVQRAVAGMNAWFGGSRLTGAERAADCMARLQGASWTKYTRCDDPRWREGAARLLRGRPV